MGWLTLSYTVNFALRFNLIKRALHVNNVYNFFIVMQLKLLNLMDKMIL